MEGGVDGTISRASLYLQKNEWNCSPHRTLMQWSDSGVWGSPHFITKNHHWKFVFQFKRNLYLSANPPVLPFIVRGLLDYCFPPVFLFFFTVHQYSWLFMSFDYTSVCCMGEGREGKILKIARTMIVLFLVFVLLEKLFWDLILFFYCSLIKIIIIIIKLLC